jgi:hypothetical protein
MTSQSTQGYVTIATGDRKYVDMAVYLAKSIFINDKKRPICLITDEHTKVNEQDAKWFSDIVRLPYQKGYEGCLNKLRIFEYSPFDETIFIDSDCLVVKKDMDRHWAKMRRDGFSIAGGKKTEGKWYNFDVSEVIKVLNIDYMCHMNSGLFYFNRNEASSRFFDTCKELVDKQKDLLACSHRRETQLADEPFIGAAMGIHQIPPVGYTPDEGAIMITTVYARKCECDPVSGRSQIYKPNGFHFLNRFFPKELVRHSPSVFHFVKLKPTHVYDRACKMIDEFLIS